ncbi:hypothetical protein PVK73_22120 [Bacillus thuringiensis]
MEYSKKTNYNNENLNAMDQLINQYVVIKYRSPMNDAGNNSVITYEASSGEASGNPELDNDIQKHIIFPLDNNLYLIVNKFAGEMLIGDYDPSQIVKMIVNFENKKNNDHLIEYEWLFQNIQDNIFKIITKQVNYYLSPSNSYAIDWIGIPNSVPSNPSMSTEFELILQDSIKIPTTPSLEEVDGLPPQYTSLTDNLPDETPHKLTGWTKIPCVMVQDNNLQKPTKITVAPYYVIKKYQYWKKIETVSLAPGESRDSTSTYGITKTTTDSMSETTGMTINKDAGLSFNIAKDQSSFGATGTIQKTITNELDIKESHTTDVMESTTETIGQVNPFDKQSLIFSKYVLATELQYIRPSENEYDPDIMVNSWTFTDEDTALITSFPPQNEISAELNKKRSQGHTNQFSNKHLNF